MGYTVLHGRLRRGVSRAQRLVKTCAFKKFHRISAMDIQAGSEVKKRTTKAGMLCLKEREKRA